MSHIRSSEIALQCLVTTYLLIYSVEVHSGSLLKHVISAGIKKKVEDETR